MDNPAQQIQSPGILPKGLGLGCSRFGSIVHGVDAEGANRLIDAALEQGIVHFDTADIYGQGDSERMLGRTLARHRSRVFLATKVGQRFPLLQRMLRPIKAPLAPIISAMPAARERLRQARAKDLPRCYEPVYLRRAVAASLKRLRIDHVDLVYVHSPSARDLTDGAAVGALDGLRNEGLIGHVGVSCDDIDIANQAVRDRRVAVLQIPYIPRERGWSDLLAACARANVLVVVRSIFGGAGSALDEAPRREIISASVSDARIRSVLVATSKPEHLRQLASWTYEATARAPKAGSA